MREKTELEKAASLKNLENVLKKYDVKELQEESRQIAKFKNDSKNSKQEQQPTT